MEKNFNLLIVDDEKDLLENLYKFLKEKGFKRILTSKNLKEAEFKIQNNNIDLIVLDLMLSDGSGFDFLKRVRKSSQIPVIILSALDGIDDRREGFENRADDYIVKPFLPEELLWRIKAVLRRSVKCKNNENIYFSNISFDKNRGVIIKNNEEIALTAKQFKILAYLADNIDRIVSIDQILDEVWGEDNFGFENTLITHIYRLREKIEDDPRNPEILLTIRGLGYKLVS